MIYTDGIQGDTIRHKMRAALVAVIESMTDNDEALDRREPDEIDFQDGFTVSMPAGLSYYNSTGTGTPLLDSLVQSHLDAQAAEWARQYPQRAPLPDCAMNEEGEFTAEAQEWEDAALQDETVWARIEAKRDAGRIVFRACFTDEVNAPHGVEYCEAIDESAFLAMGGDALAALIARIAEAPYLSPIVVRNSGGLWHAWLGTADGKTAHYSTGGHATEAAARTALERVAAWAAQ